MKEDIEIEVKDKQSVHLRESNILEVKKNMANSPGPSLFLRI
jgi:hypothetical protein